MDPVEKMVACGPGGETGAYLKTVCEPAAVFLKPAPNLGRPVRAATACEGIADPLALAIDPDYGATTGDRCICRLNCFKNRQGNQSAECQYVKQPGHGLMPGICSRYSATARSGLCDGGYDPGNARIVHGCESMCGSGSDGNLTTGHHRHHLPEYHVQQQNNRCFPWPGRCGSLHH